MEEIKLLLSATTHGLIKKVLNDFIIVLNGQKTEDGFLCKLSEQTTQLITELDELERISPNIEQQIKGAIAGLKMPVKVQLKTAPKKQIALKTANDGYVEWLSFSLDHNLRGDIVNLLRRNLDFPFKYLKMISSEVKQELISENDLMIETLRHLESCESSWKRLPKNQPFSSACDNQGRSNLFSV